MLRVLGIIWVFSVIVSFAARADDAVAPAATTPAASTEAATADAATAEKPAEPGTATGATPVKVENKKGANAAALLGPAAGLQWTASYSLFAGVQTDADNRSAQSSLSIGANYKLHPKIFASVSLTPYLDMTPHPNNNRRWDMQRNSSFARLNFRNLLTEEFTGLKLGGNVTYQLPVSMDDWLPGNRRFGQVAGAVQVFKSAGDFTFALSEGMAFPLWEQAASTRTCDVAANAAKGVGCPPGNVSAGASNVLYSNSTGATVIWGSGAWSFFGSFGLIRSVTYTSLPSLNPTNTWDDNNKRYSFSFVAQLAYSLTDHLSLNGGLFNGGPQVDDRYGYNNFFFDKTLAAVFTGIDWVQ